MGGGSGSQQQQIQDNSAASTALATNQEQLLTQYANLAQNQLSQQTQLDQPSINYYNAITGGNQQAALSAVAPQLGQIAQQTQVAGANIMNQVPAGAGRDYALAQNQIAQGQSSASTLNSAFTGALAGQQQLGAQALGAGLQEQGATLSAASGATSSLGASTAGYQDVAQIKQQQKASTMGFLGSLAGAAGDAASGGVFGTLSDARLKEDIEKVGVIGDVNLYRFKFKDSDEPQIGFMAQEVYTKHPESVIVGGEDPEVSPWRVKYQELLPQLVNPKDE